MKIREILRNFKFYCEYPKGKYSIYFSRFSGESYGVIARFKDLESIKKNLLTQEIDQPYRFKSVNINFLYKDQKESYALLKREYFDELAPEKLKESEKDIKKIVKNSENVENRKNLNLKLIDIEQTDLPQEIKNLKEYVEKKNMYFNILLKETDQFNVNLIFDKENLYFRIYPKNENLMLEGFDFYQINNRTYFIAPVRLKNNLDNIYSLKG